MATDIVPALFFNTARGARSYELIKFGQQAIKISWPIVGSRRVLHANVHLYFGDNWVKTPKYHYIQNFINVKLCSLR